jgi:Uma2 family endonuclease
MIHRLTAPLNAGEAKARQAFYEWAGDDTRAEFINGEIIRPSPTSHRSLNAEQNLCSLLSVYVNSQQLGEVAFARAMVSLTRNDYEPDICFWRKEVADAFDDDMLYFPAPDLIVEGIQLETEARDRGIKFEDYAAHGVREYWLVDPARQTVEQFELDEAFMAFDAVGNFHINDSITALTLPDFTIPVRAIFEPEANAEALKSLLAV